MKITLCIQIQRQTERKRRGKGQQGRRCIKNIKEEEGEEEDECPPSGKALNANSVSALSLNDISFGP